MNAINITNIPRYSASFPLQKEFVTNADGCGDHVFTQIKRTGNVAVYRRTRVSDGKVFGFETIIIKTVKAGTLYAKGSEPTKNDTESYPGSASFGKLAFSFYTQFSSLEKLEELVKVQEEKDQEQDEGPVTLGLVTSLPVEDESNDIPTGEFTQTDFATANCLPPRGSVYNIIQRLVVDGVIRVSRQEQRGPGRPTTLFTRVV